MEVVNARASLSIKELSSKEDSKTFHAIIEIPMQFGWINNPKINILKGHEKLSFPMKYIKKENEKVYFECNFELETRAIYHYYASYNVNGLNHYITKSNDINKLTSDDMWKMSVNFDVPDWAKGKIMYHIFVDRFYRGSREEMKEMPRRTTYKSFSEPMRIGPDEYGIWNNDFYGGDLKGIIEKLDYIKSLGVTILYLSPIVWSQSNHRYDTADYENVDPYAGTNDDLKELCEAAHQKGMKVVLDAVFNHTGNDSKYFNEYDTFSSKGAFNNEDSPYKEFYRYYIENGITRYSYWWGMPNLPVCNGESKKWKEFITGENGVIDKWFELGIDGLRLDVADELSDEFLRLIRTAVKRNKKDGFILGEVWKNPMRMNRMYIEEGKEMDSVMNYSLIDALIRYFKYADSYKLSYIINDILREYPKNTIDTLMNFTSTHDITRAINLFATNDFNYHGEWAWDTNTSDINWCKNHELTKEQYEYGKKVYQAYVFALTFMPGILSIFYGDEVGLQGMGNLNNRKPFPWNNIDKELLNFFIQIGKIRKEQPFLEEAELKVLDINPETFLFERINNEQKSLIAINRTENEKRIYIPDEYEKSNNKVYTLNKSNTKVLTPYGAVAIKKEQ